MANNIIVKVGKKSNLAFSKSKVYRAITVDEINLIYKKHSECHIVVIENIKEDEQESAKGFIEQYLKADEQNKVLFYIPDNDDITSGIADELEANIYLKKQDLYNIINKTLNTNVSIFLDDKKKAVNDVGSDDDFGDAFGDAFGDENTNIDIDELDKELENMETAAKEAELNINKQKAEAEAKIEKAKAEAEKAKQEAAAIKAEAEKMKREAEQAKAEAAKAEAEAQSAKAEASTAKAAADEITKAGPKVVEKVVEKIVEKPVEKVVEVSSAEDTEKIIELQQQLADAKYEYELVLDDMKQANKRIENLEKLVKATASERDDIKARFEEIIDTDNVLEDPIALDQYQLKDEELKEKLAKITELNNKMTSLNKEKQSLEDTIKDKESSIDDYRLKIEELNSKLDNLNEVIKSGEIHKEELAEADKKYKKLEAEKRIIENELAGKDATIASREDDIALLKEQVLNAEKQAMFEAQVKLEQTRVTQSAFLKLKDISDKLNTLESEKQGLNKTIEDLQSQLNNALVEVNSKNEEVYKAKAKVAEVEQQMTLQDSLKSSENTKYTSRINSLETQLDVLKEQLKTKETQYDLLVQTSGIDEQGASSLVNTNKKLQATNNSLVEQLGALQKQMGTFKNANKELANKNIQLEEQCKQLRGVVSQAGINSSGTASVADPAALIAPIDYRGAAQIITVSGSGSFGITTTAMSLAYKLMITSKVLYVDFDFVTAKADSWFKKLPILNIPGLPINNMQATGLGILFECGYNMFASYFNQIVIPVEKGKGGQLDYLSGLYYRPDPTKIVGSDLSSFFNLLGQHYDYIVVDRGILGASSIVDRLQKVISDIASKNIVVTTKDAIELRNFRNLLNTIGININNVQWMLNLAQDTGFDVKLRKHIEPARYGHMLFNSEIFGKREKFSKTRQTREVFETFINNVVFGK